MIRAIAFIVVTVSYLLVVDIRVLLRRVFAVKRVEPFLNRMTREHARGILNLSRLFLGIKMRDETSSALRASLPPRFIALTNHQSLMDIVLVYLLFPANQMRFVAKDSLGNGFPGVSQTLRFQRHALIQRRGNARQLVDLMARYARRCTRKGYCPAIFPEGTRSRTGELGTFQAAGLRMILEHGRVPLVIGALDGGYKISTMKDFLGTGTKRLRMKIVGVIPAPTGKEETAAALDKARSMIAQQLQEWRA